MLKITILLILALLTIGGCAPREPAGLETVSARMLKSRDVVLCPLRGNRADDYLCVISSDKGDDWFLISSDCLSNRHLGRGLMAMGVIDALELSPDGRHLAVLCHGEGHPIVEVVDLEALLAEKDPQYRVLYDVDPYPGTISIDRWSGDRLLLSSDMLLTCRGREGAQRVPTCLELSSICGFALSISTGKIEILPQYRQKAIAELRDKLAQETSPGNASDSEVSQQIRRGIESIAQ